MSSVVATKARPIAIFCIRSSYTFYPQAYPMEVGRRWAPLLVSFLCGAGAVFPQSQNLSGAVGKYCVPCHNARYAEANVVFDALDSTRPWASPDIWERVLRQLRARTMPPTD